MQIVEAHGRLGSRLKWAWFELRATRLRLARTLQNRRHPLLSPSRDVSSNRAESTRWATVAGCSVTPLWTAQSAAEEKLVEGKVHNLRIAASRLNGQVLAAGEVFSFWKLVGPPWRSRGFVEGRELREGCLIAGVGGGLCQLSNALHLAALEAGMEIVERHAHSKIIPGSVAATGRDATVFWNYKDLRFRSTVPFVVDARLTDTHLVVQFRSKAAASSRALETFHHPDSTGPHEPAGDCLACQHYGCVHHLGGGRRQSHVTYHGNHLGFRLRSGSCAQR